MVILFLNSNKRWKLILKLKEKNNEYIYIDKSNDYVFGFLRKNISHIENVIIFDITRSGESKINLVEIDGNYSLSFTRPLFFNILSPPLAEYEFIFSVKKSFDENSLIVGKIRFKNYFVGALIFSLLIIGFDILTSIQYGFPIDLSFVLLMPSLLMLILVVELVFLEKK